MQARKLEEGRIRIEFHPYEAMVLENVPQHLEQVLTDPDAHGRIIDRLFPPTFRNDPEAEAEHRRLLGETMLERRREDLAAFSATLARLEDHGTEEEPMEGIELEPPEVALWLRMLNDLRLLLATELGIEEEGDGQLPPTDARELAVWQLHRFLTGMQQMLLVVEGFDVEDSGPPDDALTFGDDEPS